MGTRKSPSPTMDEAIVWSSIPGRIPTKSTTVTSGITTRGVLKAEASWMPSSALGSSTVPSQQDDSGGIGKQFVTKVKAKATNLFSLSR
jgi:hypothetical protein